MCILFIAVVVVDVADVNIVVAAAAGVASLYHLICINKTRASL